MRLSHVLAAIGPVDKSLGTKEANVWPLSRVDVHVVLVVSLFHETLSTNVAIEWSLGLGLVSTDLMQSEFGSEQVVNLSHVFGQIRAGPSD